MTLDDLTADNPIFSGPDSRFRYLKTLGTGGMGEVCLAEDTQLHRKVAIKTIRPDLSSHDTVRRRIARECLLHARVGSHPNIVTLFDKLEIEGRICLVMEYVDGELLQDYLLRCIEDRGSMPTAEALAIVEQCLDALTRIHQHGIVHRDIKPSNILLTWDETHGLCPKLMDFGIAYLEEKEQDSSRLTHSGSVGPGTPLYMAPEQIDSQRYGAVSPATDLYAVGVILHEMVAGAPPFMGSFTEIFNGHLNNPVPPVSAGDDPVFSTLLTHLLAQALAKDPLDRFASASAFRTAVLDILAPERVTPVRFLAQQTPQSQVTPAPSDLPPPTQVGDPRDSETLPRLPEIDMPAARPRRPRPRRAALAAATLAAAALLAMLGVVQIWARGTPDPPASTPLHVPVYASTQELADAWAEVVLDPEAYPEDEDAGQPEYAGRQAPGAASRDLSRHDPALDLELFGVNALEQTFPPMSVAAVQENRPRAFAPDALSTGAFEPDLAASTTGVDSARAGDPGEPDGLVAGGSRPGTYVVRQGDTFNTIAAHFGIDRRELARWNRVRTPGKLAVGTMLLLQEPDDAPETWEADWSAPVAQPPAPLRPTTDSAEVPVIPILPSPAPEAQPDTESERPTPTLQRQGPRVRRISP